MIDESQGIFAQTECINKQTVDFNNWSEFDCYSPPNLKQPKSSAPKNEHVQLFYPVGICDYLHQQQFYRQICAFLPISLLTLSKFTRKKKKEKLALSLCQGYRGLNYKLFFFFNIGHCLECSLDWLADQNVDQICEYKIDKMPLVTELLLSGIMSLYSSP